MAEFLDSPIEYLKGVGPLKADMLRKELGLHNFRDLLFDFPFRYIDRTVYHRIAELRTDGETVQLVGQFRSLREEGIGRKKRLIGQFFDETGQIDVIWFQSVSWVRDSIKTGEKYILFGRISRFKSSWSMAHPEVELFGQRSEGNEGRLEPVYSSTEKLSKKGLDSRGRRRIVVQLIRQLQSQHLPENLPGYLVTKFRFLPRYDTLKAIHFPQNQTELDQAINRLKFEELFFLQLKLLATRIKRKRIEKGLVFGTVGTIFHSFYEDHLPFELTNAQKRVMKEIRADMGSGTQMNRLLQGDVGSGKTMVALLSMLIALDNGYQCCLMAPTEILAQQHLQTLAPYAEALGLEISFLSGSVTGATRKELLQRLKEGEIHILIGTHAVLEDPVEFSSLGLAIIDEQHRFGVKQRAALWQKGATLPPHILIMTATPIPRTLAMTFYGDLEVSVIDELPPGRKPVKTIHRTEAHRPGVIKFMKEQIAIGRQIYVLFPLIEESETLDLENLQAGYEKLLQWFPLPEYQISVVHGRMKSSDKDYEMDRFIQKQTHIMVATTVIEVGVNVPNASVMLIENAERFGLSQLHQLRGRVGRGADQSFCILLTGYKMSKEAKERIRIMCRTNDGFEIAEADLKLRGPGEITGTRQSGALEFKLVNLARDAGILQLARRTAEHILQTDPEIEEPEHLPILRFLSSTKEFQREWYKIS